MIDLEEFASELVAREALQDKKQAQQAPADEVGEPAAADEPGANGSPASAEPVLPDSL